MNTALAVAIAFVGGVLAKVAHNLWEALWAEIFEAVAAAEQKWTESGQGAAKKEWVMATVMSFIESKAKLNIIQKMIVQFMLSKIIDALIKTLNDELGKDWVAKAKEIERRLAGLLPVVE